MFNLSRDVNLLAKRAEDQAQLLRMISARLAAVSKKLDIIITSEDTLVSAVDDLKAKLQAVSDEADTITAGIKAVAAAQASGNQTAVDNAVADLTNSVNAVKDHVDAAQAALTAIAPAAPAPADPTAAPSA